MHIESQTSIWDPHVDDYRQIFPPVNPYNYHQSRYFVGGCETALTYWPPNQTKVKIFSDNALIRNRLMDDFERVLFERVGMLMGEYVAFDGGFYVMDRKGNCFTTNFPSHEPMVAGRPFTDLNHLKQWQYRQWLLDSWDQLPLVENATLWSHIYFNNYYHFTFEVIQKARLTRPYGVRKILIPEQMAQHQFQRDLLAKTLGESVVAFQRGPVRMINPVLADAWQSYEALGWLRRTMALDVQPGKTRYYVRRAPTTARKPGQLSESVEFRDFIDRHGFKIVDFGSGEVPIADQINMLRDAEVILAPHGAGLTNIAYLNPPLTIIEYFSRRVLFAGYMQIAISLAFRYFGLNAEDEGADQSIMVDVKKLDAIMEEIAS